MGTLQACNTSPRSGAVWTRMCTVHAQCKPAHAMMPEHTALDTSR